LLQRQIQFSELTEVEAIAEGGFGVIHRAKHPEWETVVYKELKSSIIQDGSRSDNSTLWYTNTVLNVNQFNEKMNNYNIHAVVVHATTLHEVFGNYIVMGIITRSIVHTFKLLIVGS